MIAVAPAHNNQLKNYTAWLAKRGFLYRILQKNETLEEYNALLLCGGPDVGSSPERDESEIKWFKEAYGKMPVLGICRGLQISNVILGGKLYENLSEANVKHTADKSIAGEPKNLESSWHDVVFNDSTIMRVNSRHHQGISDLAPGLEVLATCVADGLPEMVTGEKALFVQWHPEREEMWGSEAEEIVYDWLRDNVEDSTPLEQIFDYLERKHFTVVSNERIRTVINESFTDEFIRNLIRNNPGRIKAVTDRNGKVAVKKIK